MERNLTTEPAKEKDANTLIIFPNIKGLNTVFVIADIETNFRHEKRRKQRVMFLAIPGRTSIRDFLFLSKIRPR
jgi:hypothetical protein